MSNQPKEKPSAVELAIARHEFINAANELAAFEANGIEQAIRTGNWSSFNLVTPKKRLGKRDGSRSKLKSAQALLLTIRSKYKTAKQSYDNAFSKLTRIILERKFPNHRGGVQAMMKWIEGCEPGSLHREFAKILPNNRAMPMDADSWESGFLVGTIVGLLKQKNNTQDKSGTHSSPLFPYAEKAWRQWKANPRNKGEPTVDEIISELFLLGVKLEAKKLIWTNAKGNLRERGESTLRGNFTRWKKIFAVTP